MHYVGPFTCLALYETAMDEVNDAASYAIIMIHVAYVR